MLILPLFSDKIPSTKEKNETTFSKNHNKKARHLVPCFFIGSTQSRQKKVFLSYVE